MTQASDIDIEIRKVCPIRGVALQGKSVRVRYAPWATVEQRNAAKAIIELWDWDASNVPRRTLQERVRALELKVAKYLKRRM